MKLFEILFYKKEIIMMLVGLLVSFPDIFYFLCSFVSLFLGKGKIKPKQQKLQQWKSVWMLDVY